MLIYLQANNIMYDHNLLYRPQLLSLCMILVENAAYWYNCVYFPKAQIMRIHLLVGR